MSVLTAPRGARAKAAPSASASAPATIESGAERRWRCRAITAEGGVVERQLQAPDEAEALRRIRALGLRPVSIEADDASLLGREFSIPGLGPRVKLTELAVAIRQFSTMTRAGVPLLRVLGVLGSQAQNSLLRTTIEAVRADVESGRSLSESMARHPRVFDPLLVSLVRAGEAAGALDVVLARIADDLERRASLRQKLRSAFSYPVVVLSMVVVVIIAMLSFVIPTFAGIYDDLGGSLPLPTRILIGASALFTRFLPVIAVGAVVAMFSLRSWRRTPAGRLRWDGWKLRLPLAGPLLVKASMARVTATIAVLVGSGQPVLETLRITAATAGNARIAAIVDAARQGVARGEPLAACLAADPLVPPLVSQLIAVGEETGTLDEVTASVAAAFEAEVETSVEGFTAMIEPLLMGLIGLVVGGMVVALYLPMFRVIDLVQ